MIDKLWLRFRISLFLICALLVIWLPFVIGLTKFPWHWIKDEYCEYFNSISRVIKDW